MKRVPRLPSGRVRWKSPALRSFIRARLAEGQSLATIARELNVPYTNLIAANDRHLFTAPPSDQVLLSEAAADCDLTLGGLWRYAVRRGWEMGQWGRERTLTRAQLDALLTERGPTTRERPPGYVTAQELMTIWGESQSAVCDRLRHVPRVAWLTRPRVTYLYDHAAAECHAPPVAPTACPRGHLTGRELARLLGYGPTTPSTWAREGCPAVKGRRAWYYSPPAVAAWLMASPIPHRRGAGRTLLTLTAERIAA